MKKLLLAFALVGGVLGTVSAQKIKKEKIEFEDLRLPLKPLGSDLKGYNFKVSTPYPEDNSNVLEEAKKKYEQEKADYPAKVAEAERLHKEAMEQYEIDMKTAQDNYKMESKAFNEMSIVERLAMADQKPVLRLPRKPSYYKPREPYYREPNVNNAITFNPNVLAQSYLKINGYDRKEPGANILEGEVTVYDYEFTEPLRLSRKESYYDKVQKKTIQRTVYYYETSYKRPTNITIRYNGKVVFSGIVDETNEYTKLTTKARPSLHDLEKKSVGESLEMTNDFINDMYGITPINERYTLRYVKDKKGKYTDLTEAHNMLLVGFRKFDAQNIPSQLNDAIAAWIKALEEKDLNNKKARINAKVAEMLTFNIVEVAYYANRFAVVEKYLEEIYNYKLNNADKRRIDDIKEKVEDRKIRYQANQKKK